MPIATPYTPAIRTSLQTPLGGTVLFPLTSLYGDNTSSLQHSPRDREIIIEQPATLTLKVMLLFLFAKSFAVSCRSYFLSSHTTLLWISLDQQDKETAIPFSDTLMHSLNRQNDYDKYEMNVSVGQDSVGQK